MKGIYSHAWLQTFFDEPLPEKGAIQNGLMRHAFEVEKVFEQNGDTIYELDILPNRANDCLAHYGIAKELAAIFSLKLNKKYFTEKHTFEKKAEYIQTEKCDRYTIIKIENIQQKETPKEMQEKLEAIGQRCINPIVDRANYLLFDIGQPIHAFDAKKVSGDFSVRQAKEGETLIILGGETITLKEADIVIADKGNNDKAIALAGIKGGEETEVDENTTDIYLETATFDGQTIRNTMRRTGKVADAALRFSQNFPAELIDYTANRAKEMLETMGTVTESFDCSKTKQVRQRKTGIAVSELNTFLGTSYSKEEVEKTLERLSLEYEYIEPRERFLEVAKKQEGKPYTWGASVTKDAPDTFDCSSFVCYCGAQAGVSLPRVSINQYLSTKKTKEPKPGDLLFTVSKDKSLKQRTESIFEAGCPTTPGKTEQGISHVLILLDDEHTIEAEGKGGENKVVIKKLDKERIIYSTSIWDGEKRFVVTIPPERSDLQNTYDLIEEIARIQGYDQVPAIEPSKEKQQPTEEKLAKQLAALNSLTALGFSEIITRHFHKKGEVSVAYPVAKDKGYLRKDLKTGMEEALTKNAYNGELLGLEDIRLVEVGAVFTKEGEQTNIALGLQETLGRKKAEKKEIEKMIQKEIGIEGGFDEEGVWEVPLNAMQADSRGYVFAPEIGAVQYTPPSKYPCLLRDIAVFIPNNETAEQTEALIQANGGEHLKNINLFDIFTKDGKTSYAFRLVFQSDEKTLDDTAINNQMETMYQAVQEKGYKVR